MIFTCWLHIVLFCIFEYKFSEIGSSLRERNILPVFRIGISTITTNPGIATITPVTETSYSGVRLAGMRPTCLIEGADSRIDKLQNTTKSLIFIWNENFTICILHNHCIEIVIYNHLGGGGRDLIEFVVTKAVTLTI